MVALTATPNVIVVNANGNCKTYWTMDQVPDKTDGYYGVVSYSSGQDSCKDVTKGRTFPFYEPNTKYEVECEIQHSNKWCQVEFRFFSNNNPSGQLQDPTLGSGCDNISTTGCDGLIMYKSKCDESYYYDPNKQTVCPASDNRYLRIGN